MLTEEKAALRRMIVEELKTAREHREFATQYFQQVRKNRHYYKPYWKIMDHVRQMQRELYGMMCLEELFG